MSQHNIVGSEAFGKRPFVYIRMLRPGAFHRRKGRTVMAFIAGAGAALIGFVMFEPVGLYGRWLKVRTWFQLFPFYRKGLFKRQKAFMKSDRLR